MEFITVPYLYSDGVLTINLRQLDYSRQIYSHIDDHGVRRHFDVNRLYQIVRANPANFPALPVPIDENIANILIKQNGIEQEHLKRISDIESPGLLLTFDDDTTLVLDGSHRLVKRFLMRKTTMLFHAFTELEARPAMLAIPANVSHSILGR